MVTEPQRAFRLIAVLAIAVFALGLFRDWPERPVGPTAPVIGAVRPAACLDSALGNYADSGIGWTGGDSAWSTPLPGGRELFAFSDSFLAPVRPPTRPDDATFVNNSFVVRDADGRFRTIVGGVPGEPASLVSPTIPGHWYWFGAATFIDGAVQVPLGEWRADGAGPLDFSFVGSSVARFDPDMLERPESVSPLPRTRGIQWGQWVLPSGEHTYVYGVEAHGDRKYLHVARVSGSDLRGRFAFWTGSGWSSRESSSTRVAGSVYAELSVHRLAPGRYMLTTMEGGAGLGNRLVGRFAVTPTGPFGPPTTLFTTPEGGPHGTYRDPDVYTYNAHVHPEFSTPTRLVISYNVNSLDTAPGGDVYRQISIYRPRFIEVDLHWPADDVPALREAERPVCR